MKVLLINSVCGIKSTGKIAAQIAKNFISEGHTCKIAYGCETPSKDTLEISYRIGSDLTRKKNALLARLFDNEGLNAKTETKRFLEWADEYNPDVLWLHNIHGYYINYEMLFAWIKSRPNMEVKWTLHDCWAFTGHCPHFTEAQCNRWQSMCHNCPEKGEYPRSILADSSTSNFERKKAAFCGVKNMTLYTPSEWLKNLVKQSFLKDYPVEVSYNEIDKTVFKPTESNLRKELKLEGRKVVLGVASAWSKKKGLDAFEWLAKNLPDDYQIVLVGMTKEQIDKLPLGILGVGLTHNQTELAQYYSMADVFVNPSIEETFGLTTYEASACGTPSIVYKDTACEEVVKLHGGIAVDRNYEALKQAIINQSEKEN